MIPIILIYLTSFQTAPGNIVRGTVLDTFNNEAVTHANLMVHGLDVRRIPPGKAYGSSIRRDGSYETHEIPVGTYLFRVSAFGYLTYIDTIALTKSGQVLVKDILLEPAIVESPPEREQYHQRLAKDNAKKPILTIQLDRHTFKNGFLTINPSVRNSATMPIVLLRINECINPISAILKDSTGEIVRANLIRVDCMGKLFPDSTDTIQIQPSQTLEYPPVHLELYDFNRLPPGRYSVSLKYQFQKPRQLCCANFRPDYRTKYDSEIETLTTALRGEFLSINSISIENKP